jgi:hypothetical protein
MARVVGTLLVLSIILMAIGEGMPNPFTQPAWSQIIFLALALIMAGISHIKRTDWWPSKVEVTCTNGQTVVQDQNHSSIGGRLIVGNRRIVVYGHDSLFKDNPTVLLKTISYLKPGP